ncbi:MAG: type II and III secretion system protein [Ignavibacteriaceae bacterium]|jgi:type IV pilus assembly protein PilQ|nr:type II and III secretion system protein [Ignavibacteriaceae bacterium]MCW8813263.1 type II and III secretion system protein [Chlorobium sp.]MCW8994342.1 type II and III secretion system protein [Psychromonas sp.]MCW8824396.1 type II and III secretion system protein [Ignavibacteriaceae bacterium]MCW8960735.1 type II and III secretion system protein [Ignavibacteriaceae bacterium]
MKNIITYFVLSLFIVLQASPQEYWERRFKTYQNPDELVTMSETLPFNQAIELLSKVSESVSGRRIVSTAQKEDPIGIEINNMPYDKALLMIVNFAGLEYETKENVIIVKSKTAEEVEKTPDTYAPITQREVKISAVFFELDVQKARKVGFDWNFLLSGDKSNIAGLYRSEVEQDQTSGQQTSQGLQPEFKLGANGNFQAGNFFGQATAVFKFFETNGIGEIISNPSIVVRDRNEGKIQIGSDFSVRTKDFAGNTTEKFFPTGTIITVTPYIQKEEGIDYILLNIGVERSSFTSTDVTTEIKKTTAATQVLMLNGEETVIGGLFTNEETVSRNGIPFLKDLPWWVFGIRYLTGYDQTTTTKKELVILLKTDMVPTLQERFENPNAGNVLGQEREQGSNRIKYYKFNEGSGEETP